MDDAELRRQIYLSPHLDDAVLSCGGRIWQQAQAGQSVTVVTVFAGVPDRHESSSRFAMHLHERWGASTDAVERRQGEDRAALALLGAEAVHWEYLDCIYRRTPYGDHAYPDEESLWGPTAPSDARLIGHLRDRTAGLTAGPGGGFHVPLGAGRHVDHRIVRDAAAGSIRAPLFYEDYPYVQDPVSVEEAKAGKVWNAVTLPLSEEALEAKIAAIACYVSQIGTFWDDAEALARSVRSHAETIGGGYLAERYWHVVPP